MVSSTDSTACTGKRRNKQFGPGRHGVDIGHDGGLKNHPPRASRAPARRTVARRRRSHRAGLRVGRSGCDWQGAELAVAPERVADAQSGGLCHEIVAKTRSSVPSPHRTAVHPTERSPTRASRPETCVPPPSLVCVPCHPLEVHSGILAGETTRAACRMHVVDQHDVRGSHRPRMSLPDSGTGPKGVR